MVEELKPCPFCGSDELSHGWSAPGYDGSMSTGNVECHNCNALIYTAGGEAEAIAAWNRRTHFAAVRNEALEEAAKVADGFHERALEWAKSVRGLTEHLTETDSSRIATAIRAMKGDGK